MELLVVTAILAVVAATIVACLAGGIRVWEEARRYETVDVRAMIAMRLVQKDIMSTVPFYAVRFEGRERAMRFPRLMRVLVEDGQGVAEETRLGTVSYDFSGEDRALKRRSWPYPQLEPPPHRSESVAERLRDMRIWYHAAVGGESVAGQWTDRWEDPTNMPQRVRVDLTFAGDSGDRVFTRIFVLPAAVAEGEGEE